MTTPWIMAFIAESVVLLLVALTQLGLLRRIVPILEERAGSPPAEARGPGGLEPGNVVPPFTASDLDGRAVTLDDVRARRDVLLFSRATCGPCRHLIEALAVEPGRDLRDRLLIVVSDRTEADELKLRELGLRVAVQHGTALFDAFATRATPHAFAIDRDGRVAQQMIPGSVDDLRELVLSMDGDRWEEVMPIPARTELVSQSR